MNYIGEKCFSCGNTFGEKDDVVVCPDCGTPYHRDCYCSAGECINHQLHESGEGWKRERSHEEKNNVKTEVIIVCDQCLAHNEESAENCHNCGNDLSNSLRSKIVNVKLEDTKQADYASSMADIDLNKKYLGFNPDEDFGGGAKLGEVSDFVNTNTLYYLPLFKRMKDLGSKLSMNFICLFAPYFFFANRKMWFWAVITALSAVLLDIPGLIYMIGKEGGSMPFLDGVAEFVRANDNFILALYDICNTADWGIRLLCCLFGNWLYMRFAVRSVNKVKAHYGGPVSPARLRSMGGVQPANMLIMLLIVMGMAVAVYMLVMFVLMFLQQAGMLA